MGQVSWVSAAYLLVISSLLLSIGRLGDMWGFKRVYVNGFVVFGLGSLCCGLSPNLPALIISRVLQAMGAAILMALGPALVTSSFPASERGRALGAQATLTYIGLTLGPTLGGWIGGQFGWHWVFLINVPVATLEAVLAMTRLRPSPTRGHQQFDFPGAVTFTLGLTAVLLGLTQAESWGWGDSRILLLLAGGLALLILFVGLERRAPQPMLPLWMFREPVFSGGVVAALLQFAATSSLNFLLPFYFEEFRGLSSAQSGAVMTAQPLAMVAVAAFAGWLSDRVGTRGPAVVGMMTMAVGLWLLAHVSAATPLVLVMLFLAMAGLGSGLFVPPNNSSIMGAASREHQGVASALLAAARNVGMVTGITMASTLFALLQGIAERSQALPDQVFLTAFQGSVIASVVLAACSAVLSLVRPMTPQHRY